MTPTLLFILAVLWIAALEAHADMVAISKGIYINHADQLTERCVAIAVTGGIIALTWCVTFGTGFLGWRFLLWPVLAWGAFTPSFRYLLNRWRGLSHLYISRSNMYDRFWLRFSDDAALAYGAEVAVFLFTFTAFALNN